MNMKTFLIAVLVLATAPASAQECWERSVQDFLRNADRTVVEDCIARGADPNARDDLGWWVLESAVRRGLVGDDETARRGMLEVIRALIAGGADHINYRNNFGQTFQEWAREAAARPDLYGSAGSRVYRALTEPVEAKEKPAAPSSTLYGAIAVAELRYTEKGRRYETPSVIAYNSASIGDAIKRAKSSCNRDFARARAYDEYNECLVYRVFSTSFRADGYHDSDGDGTSDTRKTRGRCGVAMSVRISYRDGSYRPLWASGAGDTKASAIGNAMAHCRDNEGDVCDGMRVRSFACNDQ